MHHPFIEFLVSRDLIPDRVARQLQDKANYVREPIGMIAVGHGLLTATQIDTILDVQRTNRDRRFGEIAVELGFLTEEQVETLVKIQQFRTSSDIAEVLALGAVLSTDDAARYLGTFLINDQEIASMMTDA